MPLQGVLSMLSWENALRLHFTLQASSGCFGYAPKIVIVEISFTRSAQHDNVDEKLVPAFRQHQAKGQATRPVSPVG
jgi:hypothetical protein